MRGTGELSTASVPPSVPPNVPGTALGVSAAPVTALDNPGGALASSSPPAAPTAQPEGKAVVRNVPALARRAQAELSSHPGFMAGVLVPASCGEELSAFQVCTKPSNLASHGGVVKAVPTKQKELKRFPRPGKSVLGSGKILSLGARAVSDGLSPAWPSMGQCHTLLLCLTGGWKAGKSWEMPWQGFAALVCTTLPHFPVL